MKELTKDYIIEIHETFNKYHPELLDISKNRNITIFLGNTGSGKTTLINFISGIKLEVVDPMITIMGKIGGKIIPYDPNNKGLKIGNNSESETLFPDYLIHMNEISKKENMLFDFPGFGDTRGIETNIINSYVLQNIIRKANSVKIIFVCSIEEVKAERGRSLKELIDTALNLCDEKILSENTGFIITKCILDKENTIKEINDFIDIPVLKTWKEKDLIEIFSIPFNCSLNHKEKTKLEKLIDTIQQKNFNNFQMNIPFKDKDQNAIEKIIFGEFEKIINEHIIKFEGKLCEISNINHYRELQSFIEEYYKIHESKFLEFVSEFKAETKSSLLIQIFQSISPKMLKSFFDQIEKKLNFHHKILLEKFKELNFKKKEQYQNSCITRKIGSSYGSNWKVKTVDDKEFIKNGEPITAWEIFCGGAIDSIRFRYGEKWGNKHGGGAGTKNVVFLESGENIVSTYIESGFAVYRLELTTSKGRTFYYGKHGGMFKKESIRFDKSLAYISSSFGNWYFFTFDYLVSSLIFYEAPFR